ncbi:hypothetical protein [Chitinophaga rhizophila]|uniref:Uncharacterized protein n=1 Tax=Chitinophaga rhizophila TaxID=2866212 RepID=A0ABS7GBX2_9BACT|nr:hypothetical protein [Chitinophaga rhizophila]MBW8684906.1 hypothetical protein [Chitinophaga rhizophila]
MKSRRLLAAVFGLLLAGASCVPPRHGPPRPPKPPRPPRPPHGAVQFTIPDTTFQRATMA